MKKILLITFIVLLSLSMLACSKEQMQQEVKVSTPTPEDLMLKQLDGPDLLAIMQSDIEIPTNQQKPNKLAIKNAYNKVQSFKIEICEHCQFAETEVEIQPNEIKIVDFSVKGVAGEKTVVIRDDLNNFYAKKSFTVKN